VIVDIVNIGGIDDHHCLNFLFIIRLGLISMKEIDVLHCKGTIRLTIPDPKDPARLKIQFASGKFIPKN
jgi:hypothetical protein